MTEPAIILVTADLVPGIYVWRDRVTVFIRPTDQGDAIGWWIGMASLTVKGKWVEGMCSMGDAVETVSVPHKEWARLTIAAQTQLRELLAEKGLLSTGVIPSKTDMLLGALTVLAIHRKDRIKARMAGSNAVLKEGLEYMEGDLDERRNDQHDGVEQPL